MAFGRSQRSVAVACEEVVLLEEAIDDYSLCEVHRVVLGSIQAFVSASKTYINIDRLKGLKRSLEVKSLIGLLW